jgi:hypothetical protein
MVLKRGILKEIFCIDRWLKTRNYKKEIFGAILETNLYIQMVFNDICPGFS